MQMNKQPYSTMRWGQFLTLKETRNLEYWSDRYMYMYTNCMETARHPSLVRAVGMLRDPCFPLYYSQNSTTIRSKAVITGLRGSVSICHIHNQLNYWTKLIIFKLAEWKACLDGKYEARVRRKNTKIRGRQTKHGYISW